MKYDYKPSNDIKKQSNIQLTILGDDTEKCSAEIEWMKII